MKSPILELWPYQTVRCMGRACRTGRSGGLSPRVAARYQRDSDRITGAPGGPSAIWKLAANGVVGNRSMPVSKRKGIQAHARSRLANTWPLARVIGEAGSYLRVARFAETARRTSEVRPVDRRAHSVPGSLQRCTSGKLCLTECATS